MKTIEVQDKYGISHFYTFDEGMLLIDCILCIYLTMEINK